MIKYICDKCKIPSEATMVKSFVQPPEGWLEMQYKAGYGQHRTLLLCPTCVKTLRIPEDEPVTYIGEHLVEILTEMVQEIVAEQMEP